MPIYAFECTACGDQFDRLQKLSDPDPLVCPECGRASVRRMLTAPSFRLAGSGWYETDFKKDGDKKRHLASNDDAGKPEEKKSETKTDAKVEKKSSSDATPAATAKIQEGKSASTESSKKSPEPSKSGDSSAK